MVETTLQFETEQEFKHELRGVFEIIAMADDSELDDGDYAAVMLDTANQFQLASDNQVLGWFFNGERIIKSTHNTTDE